MKLRAAVTQNPRERRLQNIVVSAAILSAVLLSLFAPWEMSGESWGYWYFAKLFAEGSGLVTPDRAPIYVLYLAPFSLLPYPYSVTAEYFFSTLSACVMLFAVLRTQTGTALALLFTLTSVLFLQQMEPPVQKLALACVCGALLIRLQGASRLHVAAGYALMAVAFLLRSSFLLYVACFLIFDLYRLLRCHQPFFLRWLRPRLATDWPLLMVLSLVALFPMFQAADPWNNVWFTTTTWFPASEKSLAASSIIGHYNWHYILSRYGSFESRDFYFTHQEAYSGAATVSGMFLANPSLFLETIWSNVLAFFPAALLNFPMPVNDSAVILAASAVLFVMTFAAAFFHSADANVRVFVTASALAALATVASMPKARYMFPLLPLVALGAVSLGNKIQALIFGPESAPHVLARNLATCVALACCGVALYMVGQGLRGIGRICVAGAVILFSYFVFTHRFLVPGWRLRAGAWARRILAFVVAATFTVNVLPSIVATSRATVRKIAAGTTHPLQADASQSMSRAFSYLRDAVEGCRGVMSLEHTFIAAFVVTGPTKAYDIWEIPPYPPSKAGAAIYAGLHPRRIDCVLESYDLTVAVGMATNAQLRYKNYLQPYIQELIEAGAEVISIPYYGRLIKARKPG